MNYSNEAFLLYLKNPYYEKQVEERKEFQLQALHPPSGAAASFETHKSKRVHTEWFASSPKIIADITNLCVLVTSCGLRILAKSELAFESTSLQPAHELGWHIFLQESADSPTAAAIFQGLFKLPISFQDIKHELLRSSGRCLVRIFFTK